MSKKTKKENMKTIVKDASSKELLIRLGEVLYRLVNSQKGNEK